MERHRALDFLSWSCPSEAPESLHGLIVIEPEAIEPAFHLRRPFSRQQLGTALNATDSCNPVQGPRWHLGSRTFSPQGWSRGPLAGTVTRGAATPPRTTASLLTGIEQLATRPLGGDYATGPWTFWTSWTSLPRSHRTPVQLGREKTFSRVDPRRSTRSRDQVFNGARCVRTIVDNPKTPHHPAGYIPPDDLQAVDRPASV